VVGGDIWKKAGKNQANNYAKVTAATGRL